MHIPDNYLSPLSCAVTAGVAAPVLAYSVKKVKEAVRDNREMAPMLGVASSLSFLMMMFNVPVPGGTTAHAVGSVLLAILMGPYAASISVSVALILQAFLFGDGGILALGANILNMAIIMPFAGYAIYRFFQKRNLETIGVIISSYVGLNLAALATAIELGVQPILFNDGGVALYNPYGLSVTIPAMMFTHLAVAGFVEAFFTLVIFKFVKRISPEKIQGPVMEDKKQGHSIVTKLRYFIIFLLILTPLGLLAEGTAFGEWSNEELLEILNKTNPGALLPKGLERGFEFNSIFPDYTIPNTNLSIGYILSAVTAILIFFILGKIIQTVIQSKSKTNV